MGCGAKQADPLPSSWSGWGRGGRSLHRGLAHHSPAQAGGPRVPVGKTASPSCEMRVLTSQGAWGPRSLQRVPWAPHSLLSSASDSSYPVGQLTGHHGGRWHPPTQLLVPASPGGSEWPGAGLRGNSVALPVAGSRPGPSCSQWGFEASGLCKANGRRLVFVIRDLMLKKNPKTVSQQVR